MVITRVANEDCKKDDVGKFSGNFKLGKTTIVYQQREDVSRGKRCAAYEFRESDESMNELSAQKWAEIMSKNDTLSEEGADELTSILKSSPYKAFFFETKGCSSLNVATKQFEFVLIDSPSLFQFCESSPDPGAFSEHFQSCPPNSNDICSFNNLGGDARLVSPKPRLNIEDSTYSHLGAFVRGAPTDQIRHMWKNVAFEYLKLFKDNPQKTFWLSTCGLGVSWLHFRLDSYPKYYSYDLFVQEK